MKYQSQIEQAFSNLGFKPRDGQVEGVNKILEAFLDLKKKNVICCAPTGTGKSIIGAVVAEAITSILGGTESTIKSSISLTATNALASQYNTTFSEHAKGKKYIMLKGANNYGCSALSQVGEEVSAESCAWFTMVQNPSEFSEVVDTHCNKCEYLAAKKLKNSVRHLTTNYSYFFVDRMYTGKFEDRDLVIWDEAHLINDLFSEHNAIYFSQQRLQKIAQEISDTIRITDISIAKTLSAVSSDAGKKDKINEKTYTQYLHALHKVYGYAAQQGQIAAERALRSNQVGAYTRLSRFVKKFEGLTCKIDDFFKYNYDHVFEYKHEENSYSVKPVFIGNMMSALTAGPRNLFMSATLTDDMLLTTLKLQPEETEFIRLPPVFPKQNKQVIFYDPLSLNFTSLQNPDTIKSLKQRVIRIVEKHCVEGNDRGIILAPSFKLQNMILEDLRPLAKRHGITLFEHRQGEKMEVLVKDFKSSSAERAILISPAMFEGIDLPGDLSRFQILLKAPFPSLGDKRMKFILDHYPSLYNILTIMKMTQGFGRSIRSSEDFATSYCLDLHGQRLFNSSANIWKDEFNIRFTKVLE